MALSNLPTTMNFAHERHLLSHDARHLLADGIPNAMLSAYRSWSAKTRGLSQAGLFVGSGVVEAGCKMICGQRLKLAGMHWTVTGANATIALRCRVGSPPCR